MMGRPSATPAARTPPPLMRPAPTPPAGPTPRALAGWRRGGSRRVPRSSGRHSHMDDDWRPDVRPVPEVLGAVVAHPEAAVRAWVAEPARGTPPVVVDRRAVTGEV